LRIGAHLSIAKGLPDAARLTRRIGGDTFGFHTRNPRGSAARVVGADEIAAWQASQASGDPLGPLVGHLPYTINLASDKDAMWDFGKRVVKEDLRRCEAFGAFAIVLHPGHHAPGDLAGGIRRVTAALEEILADTAGVSTLLLLEGMAGQTGEVGGRPEDLGAIVRDLAPAAGLGVCLDTCHLWAAGWDLATAEGLAAMWEAFDAAVGADRVRALHLNDSKFERGSHRDRHALLGQGTLGEAGVAAVLHDPRFRDLPAIIETPVDKYEDYAGEIAVARRLAG
jgi:deoxyribonuclease-4